MTQRDSARASWSALEAPWRAAIEMAWQSYRDGGIAAGAVLTDAAGAVIGEGRNDEVRRRWPQIHGPLPGPIGARLAIAPCLNTSGALLRAMERTAPRNIALARAVHSRYQETAHLPDTAAQALEDAWDLLTDSTR